MSYTFGDDALDVARCRECGGVLEIVTDGQGRLVESCPTCEQRARQRQASTWRRAA